MEGEASEKCERNFQLGGPFSSSVSLSLSMRGRGIKFLWGRDGVGGLKHGQSTLGEDDVFVEGFGEEDGGAGGWACRAEIFNNNNNNWASKILSMSNY